MSDSAMVSDSLLPGLNDPGRQSAQFFRDILDAMSRPGVIVPLENEIEAPGGLPSAAAVILLCLCDADTPVYLDYDFGGADGAIAQYLRFHTGAPMAATPGEAGFLVAGPEKIEDYADHLSIGTPEYPDRSTTLLIPVTGFGDAQGVSLTGPGIEDTATLSPNGVTAGAWQALQRNAGLYPQGFDTFFAAPQSVAGLPRSSTIKILGSA